MVKGFKATLMTSYLLSIIFLTKSVDRKEEDVEKKII